MTRSFRFQPPTPRPDLLTRPRLLRALLGRWDHQVVAIVGGPGLGKTTLLGQALAENRLAPRGEDVWVGLEPRDAGGETLAYAVAEAVGAVAGAPVGAAVGAPSSRSGPPVAIAVADQIWRRAPTEVCVVLDDVHHVPRESPGARWLAELVESLPANGHVVLAGRTEPPLPLTRLRTQRAAVLVDEADLRFSDEELTQLAARRGLDPERFGDTGGWPAMAELASTVEEHLAGAYVWEEVLEPLGPSRRRVLAVVSDLSGADDDLAAAALGEPVSLAVALDGVPLVAAGTDGARVPHPLWRTVPELALAEDDRAEIRRRAVAHLLDQGRFDDAFALVSEAGLWDLAPSVLRATCVAGERPARQLLRRWMATAPPEVADTPPGRLAGGLLAAATGSVTAFEPLQAAAEESRALGDVDAELTALAELGRLAWWHQDLTAVAPVAARVAELARTGHPLAQGLTAIGQAVVADVAGDDDAVLAALAAVEPGVLDAGWTAGIRWLEARIRLSAGDVTAALEIIERTDPGADPAMRSIFGLLRIAAWWASGRIDDVRAEMPRAAEAQTVAGIDHNRRLALLSAGSMVAHLGEAEAARRYLDRLGPLGDGPLDQNSPPVAAAVASVLLAEGDEPAAVATLRSALARSGLERSIDRRAWRGTLPLVYVLLPETRDAWDAMRLGGWLATARSLAAAVVEARSGPEAGPPLELLRSLALPELAVVRTTLHFRLAAELAVGLAAARRAEGPALLEALGEPGRAAVRALAGDAGTGAAASPGTGVASGAAGRGVAAKQAKALLAAVPAPPPARLYLAVLGPLELRRGDPPEDGEVVSDADLRRERVRALLAYLVSHRSTTRAAITASLWPDLDERSAANNLRVTLTYLLRVLEPGRQGGEPGYLVRLDGVRVELVTGSHLVIDVDRFLSHVDAAAQAEASGSPSAALEHGLAAADLYRGELFADMADAEWTDLDREHYRSRFVTVAIRSAQLLLGHGDADHSEATARRVLEIDPWAEDAYGVLAAAALARGDRSAARRQLDRCLTALADLGVSPSEATQRLRRRIRTASAAASAAATAADEATA